MSNCSSDHSAKITEEIQRLYTQLALHPDQEFGWGKGKKNAMALGYDKAWLERLPAVVWESAAAVGNPFGLGAIHRGETVIDLGCGAGVDLCIAALLAEPSGHVIGVDVTPAMVEKARANVGLCELQNVEVVEGDIAALPFPDACADVVLSNGAINLSPKKSCVLKEALRVLKPGGRLQITDMVRASAQPLPDTDTDTRGSWANCVMGTLTPQCFQEMLRSAGFDRVEFIGETGYRTSDQTVGALFRALKPASR